MYIWYVCTYSLFSIVWGTYVWHSTTVVYDLFQVLCIVFFCGVFPPEVIFHSSLSCAAGVGLPAQANFLRQMFPHKIHDAVSMFQWGTVFVTRHQLKGFFCPTVRLFSAWANGGHHATPTGNPITLSTLLRCGYGAVRFFNSFYRTTPRRVTFPWTKPHRTPLSQDSQKLQSAPQRTVGFSAHRKTAPRFGCKPWKRLGYLRII